MTFRELAEKVLSHAEYPMTVSEIWKYAEDNGYTDHLNSTGKTPVSTLHSVLGSLVKKENLLFIRINERPKRYFLKSRESELKDIDLNQGDKKVEKTPSRGEQKIVESSLHPDIAYFAYNFLDNVHTKTINASVSKTGQKGENEWLHPDMVGCSFAFEKMEKATLDINQITESKAVALYSFELKTDLNFSNLRKYFFQAVSNSSWAHYGYLASARIDEDSDFRTELERLSSYYGIGIIEIDHSNHNDTQVLYSARYNNSLDWDFINKLANMNKHFSEFLKRIKSDEARKEVYIEKYDKVPEID